MSNIFETNDMAVKKQQRLLKASKEDFSLNEETLLKDEETDGIEMNINSYQD